jgi:hypothetical protein
MPSQGADWRLADHDAARALVWLLGLRVGTVAAIALALIAAWAMGGSLYAVGAVVEIGLSLVVWLAAFRIVDLLARGLRLRAILVAGASGGVLSGLVPMGGSGGFVPPVLAGSAVALAVWTDGLGLRLSRHRAARLNQTGEVCRVTHRATWLFLLLTALGLLALFVAARGVGVTGADLDPYGRIQVNVPGPPPGSTRTLMITDDVEADRRPFVRMYRSALRVGLCSPREIRTATGGHEVMSVTFWGAEGGPSLEILARPSGEWLTTGYGSVEVYDSPIGFPRYLYRRAALRALRKWYEANVPGDIQRAALSPASPTDSAAG